MKRRTALVALLSLALAGILPGLFVAGGNAGFPKAAAAASNGVIFAGVNKSASFLAVQNVGTDQAEITYEYYTQFGNRLERATTVVRGVDPGGMRQIDPFQNNAVPDDFSGTVVATSPNKIVGAMSRAIEPSPGNRAWAGRNGYAYPGTAGFTGVSLPYVTNNLEGIYRTRIVVANAGSALACVTLTYAFVPGIGAVGASGRQPIVDNGTSAGGCSRGYPVPVHGQMIIDSEPGNRSFPSGTENTQMAATVTSTGAPIYAAVDAFVGGGNVKHASYDGFVIDDTGTAGGDLGKEVYIPVAIKSSDGFYTQILMSNPSPNPAAVKITYRGEMGTFPVNLVIPPRGTMNHSVYSDTTVPVGFVGAASIDANENIAAVLFRMKMTRAGSFVDEDIYTAVNGVARRNAATELAVPIVRRRLAGSNSWVSVVVDGGGKANLTFRWVANKAGDVFCDGNETRIRTRTINGSFILYLNLDVDNGLDAAPPCFSGSLVLLSDVPVFAVSSEIHPDGNRDPDIIFNAVPIR